MPLPVEFQVPLTSYSLQQVQAFACGVQDHHVNDLHKDLASPDPLRQFLAISKLIGGTFRMTSK